MNIIIHFLFIYSNIKCIHRTYYVINRQENRNFQIFGSLSKFPIHISHEEFFTFLFY